MKLSPLQRNPEEDEEEIAQSVFDAIMKYRMAI